MQCIPIPAIYYFQSKQSNKTLFVKLKILSLTIPHDVFTDEIRVLGFASYLLVVGVVEVTICYIVEAKFCYTISSTFVC